MCVCVYLFIYDDLKPCKSSSLTSPLGSMVNILETGTPTLL